MIRIVSGPPYRDTYRIVTYPYRDTPSYSGTRYSGTWLYMVPGGHVLHTLDSTVDYRYLAPVGSQNSRARVKWLSRRPQPVTCRITDPHSGVYNSQTLTVCWAIIAYESFLDLYTHWHRTSNKSQQATLDFDNHATKLSNHTLRKATHNGFCVEISQPRRGLTGNRNGFVHARPVFTKVAWASQWQIRESHFK